MNKVPLRARRVGSTQSKRSMPAPDEIDQVGGSAGPHEIAGLLAREVGRRRGCHAPRMRPAAPRRTVRRAHSRRIRAPIMARALSSRRSTCVPPWTMPKTAWSARVRAAAARCGPPRGALRRRGDRRPIGVARRAFVEDHRHVAAETLLGANHVFGRQRVGAAVDVRAERDSARRSRGPAPPGRRSDSRRCR